MYGCECKHAVFSGDYRKRFLRKKDAYALDNKGSNSRDVLRRETARKKYISVYAGI